MKLYIDESGTFAPVSSPEAAVSCVGVLAIPSCHQPRLFKRYERLRERLPKANGEVKGRLLSEKQIATVIELLRRQEILFEATAIDMGLEDPEVLKQHREGQADAIVRGLTPEHASTLQHEVLDLVARLCRLV